MKVVYKMASDAYAPDTPSSLHPVLQKVLAQRGVVDAKHMEHPMQNLLPPDKLLHIDQFSAIFSDIIQGKMHVMVVGDYDCDGATSTALAIKALRLLGHQNVQFVIPDRFTFGYGLSPALVANIHHNHPSTQVLLTVDNGTSSIEGVRVAKALGWTVVVTDHHCPGDQLPEADVIINPQLPGDAFPSKALAGVGVVFYAMLALREHLHQSGYFENQGGVKPHFGSLLDLVAFGTVADCVPLDYNNRLLVHHGLKRIRNGKCSVGLSALMEMSGVSRAYVCAQDISFKLAPKLNAAGRLDDMTIGVSCLLTEDYEQAYQACQALCMLNESRQSLQHTMQEAAFLQIEKTHEGQRGICVKDAGWHQGVIGILASRIKETMYQPTVVFAYDEDGKHLKGSCRSIPGIHIRDILAGIAASNPSILSKFGGHAMAAGLTIQIEHYERFKTLFHLAIASEPATLFEQILETDGPLAPEDITLDTALALSAYGIWGQGFPEPIFANHAIVHSIQIMKEKHLKMRLFLDPSLSTHTDATWFFAKDCILLDLPKKGEALTVYYKLQLNHFRQRLQLALIIEHVERTTLSSSQDTPLTLEQTHSILNMPF